jgi:hypothetical protein
MACVLRAFARGAPEYHFETFAGIVGDPKRFEDVSLGSAWKNCDGKIDSWFINPLELFLADLRGAEVDRIRECSVCRRLFFANRKDQPCCKPACANVRRVRIARGNWEE